MFRTRRTAAVVCAGVGAATALSALSACSAGHTAVVTAGSDPAVVFASTVAATSLDFTTTGGAAIPAALMGNVYETLVTINPDSGEIEPLLAHSWDVSPDGKKYTFHLREAITFSNGDAFTAETAAFSINYVRNDWANGISSQLDVVDSARAIDNHTLEVTLQEPSQRWLWSMSTAVGAMMTPSAMDKLASNPVGTGPFTVANFTPADFVALRVNPDYWGEKAHEDITIKYFPDTISSVNALQSGSVDVVLGVQNPELLSTIPKRFRVLQGSTNGELLISMNNQAAPFNDPRVRQAVAYGIDREAANQVLFNGLGQDTGGAPVAPADPWFTDKNYYPFNPERARQLMEEAGAVGTPLRITVPSLPYTQMLSELVYSQLKDIGFQVTLETAEFPAVWLSQVFGAKDYQMSMIAHVEPRDITKIFGSPDYYIGYDSARTQQLFAHADTATNPTKSTQLMQQSVDAIMEDMPALTVLNFPNIVLTAPGISGVNPTQVTDGLVLKTVEEK
ncbi:peptide ABC transporter substrate-binding protein [Corynebacterium phocae]|uniref:Peptide ABC transporter substrate-binding protein n=1 Tax=Corynebacterium phocae TaxID=161895 RepID=A0A1L7D643_9CORY|nr:ABC transporter substrate-binding protein [Corynebacterium phocae]APT93636.1 peptide ABC transporter substrate-binding protein [Corynebacterium phocae]KAA8726545.1 ABC transporter substrate-binding protein [Corynebacterium phocae]